MISSRFCVAKWLAHRAILSLALAGLLLSVGCNPSSRPKTDAKKDTASPDHADLDVQDKPGAGQPPASDQAAADKLRSAGAVVTLSGASITALEFRDAALTDDLAQLLPDLNGLTKLAIYSSELSDSGWQTLGQLTQLQHLDLRGCAVSNAQLISAASDLPKLRSLRLSGKSSATTVDDDGLIVVLAKCPELKVLAADDIWISEDSLAKLANPSGLLELYLARTLVEDEALKLISDMSSLKKLRLAGTNVTGTGLELLEKLPLEDLDLSECQQFDDSAMVSIGKLKSLKRLNLWRTTVTDAGVGDLAGLTQLTWLNLDNIPFSDDGLAHLSEMQKLKFLHLGSTEVTNAGMPKLIGLSSLEDLRVTRTAVTEEGVAPLREAHPEMKIQIKYIEGE